MLTVNTHIISLEGECAWVDGHGEVETGPNVEGIIVDVLPEQERCYSVLFGEVWIFLSEVEVEDTSKYLICSEQLISYYYT